MAYSPSVGVDSSNGHTGMQLEDHSKPLNESHNPFYDNGYQKNTSMVPYPCETYVDIDMPQYPNDDQVESGMAPHPHDDHFSGSVAPHPHDDHFGGGVAPHPHYDQFDGGVAPHPHDDYFDGGVAPHPHDDHLDSGMVPHPHDDQLESGMAPYPHDYHFDGGVAPRPHDDHFNCGVAPHPHDDHDSGMAPHPHHDDHFNSGMAPHPHDDQLDNHSEICDRYETNYDQSSYHDIPLDEPFSSDPPTDDYHTKVEPFGPPPTKLHRSRLGRGDHPPWLSHKTRERIHNYHDSELDRLGDTFGKLKQAMNMMMAGRRANSPLTNTHSPHHQY